jgi:methyltransferase family protein
MANLLLHSMREFDEVILAIIDRVRPRSLLEIGAETGAFTERLVAYCEANGGKLVTIDPAPHAALVGFAQNNDTLTLVIGLSIPYLRETGCDADFALIDGDHNYYTVSHELELIHSAWKERGTQGTMLLHDVGFPCAERDFYYNPESIPEDARHPYSYTLGVTLGSEELIAGGFRGEGQFAWALKKGGEKNGVLTAVRDFCARHDEYVYRSIEAVFGLGALTLRGSPADAVVAEAFGRYDTALVRRLEQNRLELYLKVLELQDRLNAQESA